MFETTPAATREKLAKIACDAKGLAGFEKAHRDFSALQSDYKAEIAKTHNPPQPQTSPPGVTLIKSRLHHEPLDPQSSYFHPGLNEWRPFASSSESQPTTTTAKNSEEVKKHRLSFREKCKDISSARTGTKKCGTNKLAISLPVEAIM